MRRIVRVLPWKSASALRPLEGGGGSSPDPWPDPIGLTLFIEDQAWIIVPSMLK